MDINNYSYSNNDNESSVLKHFENDTMYIDLEYCVNDYFQEQFYSVTAYSYENNLDISEEFNELLSANKLFNAIKKHYSNADNDILLDAYIENLHSVEQAHKPLLLLI